MADFLLPELVTRWTK